MKNALKTQGSTLFLRVAIIVIGLLVLMLCLVVLPAGIQTDAVGYAAVIWVMYGTTLPFYYALYQALKLLEYIDTKKAFSQRSVKALKHIKISAMVISGAYALCLPYIYYLADQDDAPGAVIIGLVLTFAPLVMAVFAAVLQKLLQAAVALKSENDLTV